MPFLLKCQSYQIVSMYRQLYNFPKYKWVKTYFRECRKLTTTSPINRKCWIILFDSNRIILEYRLYMQTAHYLLNRWVRVSQSAKNIVQQPIQSIENRLMHKGRDAGSWYSNSAIKWCLPLASTFVFTVWKIIHVLRHKH